MNRRNWVGGSFALLTAIAIVACANGNQDDGGDPAFGADAASDAPVKHDAAKEAGDSGHSGDTGGGLGEPDATPTNDVDAADAEVAPVDATTPVDAGADAKGKDTGVDAPVTVVDSGDAGIADTGVDARDASVLDSGFDAGGFDAGGFDAGDASTCPTGTPILVNELQADGVDGADEFVELYNPNDCTLALAGYTLKYSSASGSSPAAHWTGGSADAIAGHAYVIVAGLDFAGSTSAMIGRFNGGSTGVLSKSGGGIGLHDASGTLVDGVAYGTALKGNPEGEGSPAAQPPSLQSIGRNASSSTSSDNAADFSVVAAPTPGAHN